jgi:hypothetical protein
LPPLPRIGFSEATILKGGLPWAALDLLWLPFYSISNQQ